MLVPLLALHALAVVPHSPSPPSKPSCEDPLQVPLYVVGFHKYLPVSELPSTIAALLPVSGWKYVPRINPAQAFPSDFALVQISAGGDALLETLRRSKLVKYVMKDRRITNSLKEVGPEPGASENSSDREEGGGSENGEAGMRFNKWKAKPFPFMGLYGRRRLLGRQPTRHGDNVAHAFHAKTLWDKGFTGKGVRVAVFDTGVMKGHPHFRDVRHPCCRCSATLTNFQC
jgi:membrane-bound transcription factor site-1 protease